MIRSLIASLFGCQHCDMSRVFTPQPWSELQRRSKFLCSYQVCLDCGAEFRYDLRTMRRMERLTRCPELPDAVAEERERQKRPSEFVAQESKT